MAGHYHKIQPVRRFFTCQILIAISGKMYTASVKIWHLPNLITISGKVLYTACLKIWHLPAVIISVMNEVYSMFEELPFANVVATISCEVYSEHEELTSAKSDRHQSWDRESVRRSDIFQTWSLTAVVIYTVSVKNWHLLKVITISHETENCEVVSVKVWHLPNMITNISHGIYSECEEPTSAKSDHHESWGSQCEGLTSAKCGH